MVVIKGLYGLKSSGRCWHDRLFEVLTDMGFFPFKAEPDIWMQAAGDHYEYIACYVDDLLIASVQETTGNCCSFEGGATPVPTQGYWTSEVPPQM
jgi:hypothetical protein